MISQQQNNKTHAHYLALAGRLHSACQDACNSKKPKRHIERQLGRLHRYLSEQDETYQHALRAVQSRRAPRFAGGWNWELLLDVPELRCGFLTTYQGNPVPLHDHPGSTGVLWIISGQVGIRQYSLEQKLSHKQTRLKRVHSANYLAGEASCIGARDGNIHSLRAVTERCTMLDILVYPYKEQDRNWYFPITETDEDMLLTHCVTTKRRDTNRIKTKFN